MIGGELHDVGAHRPGFPKGKAERYRHTAIHAAREDGALACRNKARTDAVAVVVSTDLGEATRRSCRSQIQLYKADDPAPRLEALFVLAITLGLRPGELRKLTWELVNLDAGVIHVWKLASRAAT